jgi:hypothetical protein
MVLGWSPFNIVSDSPALHSRGLLLLKIEISSSSPVKYKMFVEKEQLYIKQDLQEKLEAPRSL